MEEKQTDIGTVVRIDGNRVRVEVQRGAGCKSCSLRGMCFGRNTPSIFDLTSELDLQPGDRVELEIAPATRILSALMVFALPLVLLFAGYLIASRWLAELPSIGVAFLAAALSFLIMKWIDRSWGGRIQVQIGRRL